MNPQYVGTWRVTEMDTWDAAYIDLVGPGYLRIHREGGGFMQFGAVEAALDCRAGDSSADQRLEFTFQGFDEGDPVSGRGWATVSGDEMKGHIYFHQGEESGFTAVKGERSKAPTRSSPKVIRLPRHPRAAEARPSAKGGACRKIRRGQATEICFSGAEKELLEEHTLMDCEYMNRLESPDAGDTWTGSYTLDDLEDMLGYIGEGEGHTQDKKIARRLASVGSRLSRELDSHDDGG